MNRRPTIRDVAKAAGVSAATASRVLNGNAHVRAHLREQVEAAIDRLDYQVNAPARMMSQGRTHILGFVAEDLHNPFMAESLELAMEIASVHGYRMVAALSGSDGQRMDDAIMFLRQTRVEGILVASARLEEPALMKLVRQDFPLVLFNRHLHSSATSFVGPDYRSGQRLATDHVIHQGHRRIALVTGLKTWSSVQERLWGFYDALDQAHLDRSAATIVHGHYQKGQGSRALQALWAQRPAPTAILTTDLLAIEMLAEARRLGIDVPEDLTIVGMDDIAFASHPRIALTTVATHFHRQAELALYQLLAMLKSGQGNRAQVIVPVELVVRDTAGPAARRSE